MKSSVTVVGLGYMGLPTALLLAEAGSRVSGFDTDAAKVAKLERGEFESDEPGLTVLFKKVRATGRFNVSSQITPASVYIIAVPTPLKGRTCDLRYVLAAANTVAKVAKDGDLVIVESTVGPGTCEKYIAPIFKKQKVAVDIVHCPERAIPGNTLYELVNNDRVVGGMTAKGIARAKKLYATFVKGNIATVDIATAEVVKLMENTYRDVNIALANEFSILGDELGFSVWEAIRLANLHPRVNILSPGPGVGGHCIAIDPWFLTEDTKSTKLIPTARKLNDHMPAVVVERLYKKVGKKKKLKVGVLGLAYKKNVSDARESPSEHIIEILRKDGHEVRAHDPHVEGAGEGREENLKALERWGDAFILAVDHDAYRNFRTKKSLIDTRDFLSQGTTKKPKST